MPSEASQRAQEQLKRERFSLPRRPGYDTPRLPRDITEVDDPALMALLVSFTRYEDHVAGKLALAEINDRAVVNQLELAKAHLLAASWTGKTTERVNVSKAKAVTDDEVQRLTEELDGCRAHRKLLSILVTSFNRDAAVVSRELTRRTAGATPEKRASRFGS